MQYNNLTLPLASHKQSFSIYCQSSPFCRVFAKVLLKWQLHVFLNHDNLYTHGIRVQITFDWPLVLGMSCSSRALNQLQTFSGIESSRKKIYMRNFKYKNQRKLFRTRAEIKDINIKLFYKFLLTIKSQYICCSLHLKSLIKPPSQFKNVTSLQKSCYLIGRLRENS